MSRMKTAPLNGAPFVFASNEDDLPPPTPSSPATTPSAIGIARRSISVAVPWRVSIAVARRIRVAIARRISVAVARIATAVSVTVVGIAAASIAIAVIAIAAPANPRPRPIPKPPQPQPRRPPQPPPQPPRQRTSVAVAGTAAFRETVLVGTEAAKDGLVTAIANAPASATAIAVFR